MKPFAIPTVVRSMTVQSSVVLLVLLASAPSQGTPSAACELSPELRAELATAAKVASEPFDFDSNIAPLLALRQRHSHDLLVHELYQDVVQHYGIEGHLRKLTEEYQVLFHAAL